MIEQPYASKTKIESDKFSLKILIPSKKNWFIIIFLSIWLVGWFFGEKSAIIDLLGSNNIGIDLFMMVWLTGWTFGGVFAIIVLLWNLAGKETIYIDKGIFQIDKSIFSIIIRSKKYETKSIKNLELNPAQNIASLFAQKNIGDFWGLTGGKLRFDYGMKTIKFGIGIDEAEARHLITEITNKGFYSQESTS